VLVALVALGAAARADDVRPPEPPPPAKATGVVTRPPKLLQAVAPDYPPAALAAGKQAAVKVRIHIDATGVVTAVDVLQHVGDGFDEAAVAAALQYVFEPAEIDGAPAAIAVETAIHFVIEQAPADDAAPPPIAPKTQPAQVHPGPPNHAGSMDAKVTLSGFAIERGTRTKLAGVIVSLARREEHAARASSAPTSGAELGLDVVTGDDGSFYFHGVPPGTYQLLAVDPRYDRVARPIVLAQREALEVRLWLRPKGGNPYETVVEGERDVLEVTRRTIDRQEMMSVPGTFGDPIRAIQTLPGIQRAPFGLGLLLVRGSNPDDTGIFVDGHDVPALFHFLGGPSIFNAEMLDSIDLYPGGFPARFGRYDGAVVALETRETKNDGWHGSAKVDFLDSGGYLRGPITKDITFAIAARRSYLDLLLGFILPSAAPGATRIVTPVYYDASAKLDWNLHANGHLSLFAITSGDSLHVLDADPTQSTDLSSAIHFTRVIGSYTRALGGDLKLTLSPAWGRDTVSYSGAEAEAEGPFTDLAIVNDSLSYRMRITGHPAPWLVLDTGIDLLSRVTSYQALVPIDDTLANSEGVNIPPTQIFRGSQSLGAAAYVDLGMDVTQNLRVIPSLRLDEYLLDGQERDSADPRLVVRYKTAPAWTLKAYVGRFSQPPQPEALDRRFGNPTVQLEHSLQYGLGYEWHPDHLWSVDSEIYYVDRYSLVEFTDAATMNADGTFSYVNFDNDGRSHSYGYEAIIKREISASLYGWLSYTYSRSREQSEPGGPWLPTIFDEPHVLNAVASWKPGAGFELGARFQLASGRPTTPVIGATYDADAGAYVPVTGPDRSVRIPTFRQLDVRAERDWLFQRWSLGVYLDIINVTDATNVEAIQYDYRYRQSSPVTSYPFLPTLGVRGVW
jgi:TonB family protein